MAELTPEVQAVMNQVTQTALQQGQQIGSLAMQNAVQVQQLGQIAAMQLLTGGMQVGQSYQGNHLRRGSEVDGQEASAEGKVLSDSAAATFPRESGQLDSLYHKDVMKGVVDSAVSQILAKLAQTTPMQTGAHAAQAPADRAGDK